MGTIFKWLGILVLALVVLAGGVGAYAAFGKPWSLKMLLDRQAIAMVKDEPELITSLGIIDGMPVLDQHSGKLGQVTIADRDAGYALAEKLRAELVAYGDPATMSPQDKLSYAVGLDTYDSMLAMKKFNWLGVAGSPYAIDQMNGQHTGIADFLINQHQVNNPKMAANYISRLKAIPTKLDQLGAEVNRQAGLGVRPPAFLFDKIVGGMADLIKPAPGDNPLVKTFDEKLAKVPAISAEKRAALVAEATGVVKDAIYPAYTRLIATVEAQRAQATNDAGIARLPQGPALYADLVRLNTSTDMTPEAIHTLGLAEVARLEKEMVAILDAEKIPGTTVGARVDALGRRPDQLFPDTKEGRDQILAEYDRILKEIETKYVPTYFSLTPKQPLEVRRVPEFQEGGAAGAYYQQPAMDGSRPGVFYANLKDILATPRFGMKTLAVHEGVPGHHFQIALAMSMTELPLIRQMGFNYTAYIEGWALYSENLAKEMGLYEGDPLGDLGRLQAEMFRATRLVVDTGLHAKGWSRDQAINYMLEKTGMARSDVETEIDRYCVMPGQALAYKIGMNEIIRLRDKARTELGDKFDYKAFHALVLENGALPLTVLAQQVETFIAEKKGGA
jgi:uncharacterized protein (DUF885 family)